MSQKSRQPRKYSRLPFQTSTLLVLTHRDAGYLTHLIDISFKGGLVATPAGCHPRVGEEAALKIQLDHSDIVIEMKGKIAHAGPERTGLQCFSIDMDSIIHLRKLMELNLGDPRLLERELLTLG